LKQLHAGDVKRTAFLKYSSPTVDAAAKVSFHWLIAAASAFDDRSLSCPMDADTFTFYCPRCGYLQKVPMKLAGRCIACPGCKTTVPLPSRRVIREETIDLVPRDPEQDCAKDA